MEQDIFQLQREAEQRVKRMQEHSRKLLEHGPTFGAGLTSPPPTPSASAPKKRESEDHWLLLLLILLLSQNGGSRSLLMALLYLAL